MPAKPLATTCMILLAMVACASTCAGQTIINVPPTVIGDNESIGSNTQLNVGPGGVVGDWFYAGNFDGTSTMVEVNISGGSVGERFRAYSGSEVNISGGTIR